MSGDIRRTVTRYSILRQESRMIRTKKDAKNSETPTPQSQELTYTASYSISKRLPGVRREFLETLCLHTLGNELIGIGPKDLVISSNSGQYTKNWRS